MRTIGNVLWFIMGGVLMGLGWWLVGLLAFISIVGIPWGRACFVIGQFCVFPRQRSREPKGSKRGKKTNGPAVWARWVISSGFLLAGIWLAIGHAGRPPPALSPSSAFRLAFSTSNWRVLRWHRSARQSSRRNLPPPYAARKQAELSRRREA